MTSLPRLKALVELAQKATPGPWWPDYHHKGKRMWPGIECKNPPAHRNYLLRMFTRGDNHEQQWHDMRFICEARNAIPALRSLLEPTEARAVPEGYKLLKLCNRCAGTGLGEMDQFNGDTACKWCGGDGIDWDAPPLDIAASPLPKAETQPVAWRAWRSGAHFDCWVYWDEDTSDSLKDCPEYSQFQALYSSPQPEAATIDAEAAIKTISNIALRALIDFDHKKISMEHAAAIIANESLRLLSKHASEHAGEQGSDPRIPGLVNCIRSLILFHTKNGTMLGDCASDFAELVAPYPSYAPSGEVIDEAAAPDSAGDPK